MAEVVSLALVLNCLPLRLIVLDAITEDRHSCAHRSISSQTYCHRVCLITRALEPDILITSAIVKIILAGVVFTSDVKTLRIDLDPTSQLRTLQTNSLDIRLVGLILISAILCLISRLRQLCRLIPCHLGNAIWFTTLLQHPASVVPRSAPLRLNLHVVYTVTSHAACGLAVPGGLGSRALASPLHGPSRALRV